jgi:hypothetical protein
MCGTTGLDPQTRPVLAAHPPSVAQLIEQFQEIGITQLTVIGFLARRYAGDLDVADAAGG